MEGLSKNIEIETSAPTPENNQNFLRAKEYGNKIEARNESLLVLTEGIEDTTLKEKIKSNLGLVKKVGRQAVAGSMFMLATHGAFGQEINTPDVEALDNTPVAETSVKIKSEASVNLSDEKKAEILDSALLVAGESMKNEAEKITDSEKHKTEEVQELEVSDLSLTLPLGAGTLDLKDPATLAHLASKLGGDIGKVGKLATYAQNSYKTLNEKDAKTGEPSMNTRKALDLLATMPFAGKIGMLAQLAGKVLDGKEKIDKGEKITAEEIFKTVISFVPHAAILMSGIELLKHLPQGEVQPLTQEDLYRN